MVFNWVHSIHYFTIFNCRNRFFILADLPIIGINKLNSIGYKIFCPNHAIMAQDLPYTYDKLKEGIIHFSNRLSATKNDSKFHQF
jgi:hypothetical protein